MLNGTKVEGVNWYSIQEAAEIYDVHPNTIRARIRAKTIPSRQLERSGRLVYEVAISDDDAALLADEQARQRAADTIAQLRVELGRDQALREQAEARAAPLERTISELTNVVGKNETLTSQLNGAQKRIEEQAEEIGRLKAERGTLQDRNDWLAEQNKSCIDLLRDARNYYWAPGFWPRVRRIFRTYKGFSRVR